MIEDDADEAAAGPSYAFRPSAFGAPRSFRLSERGLAWEIGRRSGVIPFDRISRVRMSYRPATLQQHRFITEIWSSEAPRLDIVSSSWKSMVEQANLGADYRAFIVELHRRLAGAGTAARFDAGVNPVIFWLGVIVFAGASLGLAALVVRALEADARLGALLIAGFLMLFLWQVGNIFYRNRPAAYRPDALPPVLLPRPDR